MAGPKWVASVARGKHPWLLFFTGLVMIEVSKLQPYTYSLLLWSAVLGFLVFNDVPDVWVMTGVAIIIASGLYAWYRQQLRGDTD